MIDVLDTRSNFRDVYKEVMLSKDQWILISEFEAIMAYTNKLAMMSQTHYPGEVSFSWFNVAECKGSLQLDKCKLACVDGRSKKPYKCWKLREHLPKKLKSKALLQEESRTFIEKLLYNLDY